MVSVWKGSLVATAFICNFECHYLPIMCSFFSFNLFCCRTSSHLLAAYKVFIICESGFSTSSSNLTCFFTEWTQLVAWSLRYNIKLVVQHAALVLLWKTCIAHFQVCVGFLSFQRPVNWLHIQFISRATEQVVALCTFIFMCIPLHWLWVPFTFALITKYLYTAVFFLTKNWSERLILFVHYFKSVLLNWYQREWWAAAVWAGGGTATKSW